MSKVWFITGTSRGFGPGLARAALGGAARGGPPPRLGRPLWAVRARAILGHYRPGW